MFSLSSVHTPLLMVTSTSTLRRRHYPVINKCLFGFKLPAFAAVLCAVAPLLLCKWPTACAAINQYLLTTRPQQQTCNSSMWWWTRQRDGRTDRWTDA